MTVYQVRLGDERARVQLADVADLGAFLRARLAESPMAEGEVLTVEIVAHDMSRPAYDALPEWDGGGKDGHGPD